MKIKLLAAASLLGQLALFMAPGVSLKAAEQKVWSQYDEQAREAVALVTVNTCKGYSNIDNPEATAAKITRHLNEKHRQSETWGSMVNMATANISATIGEHGITVKQYCEWALSGSSAPLKAWVKGGRK